MNYIMITVKVQCAYVLAQLHCRGARVRLPGNRRTPALYSVIAYVPARGALIFPAVTYYLGYYAIAFFSINIEYNDYKAPTDFWRLIERFTIPTTTITQSYLQGILATCVPTAHAATSAHLISAILDKNQDISHCNRTFKTT